MADPLDDLDRLVSELEGAVSGGGGAAGSETGLALDRPSGNRLSDRILARTDPVPGRRVRRGLAPRGGGDWFGPRYLTSMATVVSAGLFCLACSARLKGLVVLIATTAVCTAFTLLFAVQYRLDLIPKASRLTVDELLWDKLHLRRAREIEASRLLEQISPARALQVADRASRELGASVRLLEIRLAASRALGDSQAFARALEDRQRYEAARLF